MVVLARAFGGFNFLSQEVSGYGCTQTATNPDICVPAIDPSVLAITQKNLWSSARIGLSGDVRHGPLQIGGDAAIVYSKLDGHDYHWLRIGTDPGDFTGGIPEDGRGWGYQLEANIDYAVTPRLSIGGGVRYWHMQTSGNTHFENHVVEGGGGPQRVDWNTTMWGWTARVAWKL